MSKHELWERCSILLLRYVGVRQQQPSSHSGTAGKGGWGRAPYRAQGSGSGPFQLSPTLWGRMAWGTPYASWGRQSAACVVHAGLAPAVKHGCVAVAGTRPGDAACSVMNSRCPVTPESCTRCDGVCAAALRLPSAWAAPPAPRQQSAFHPITQPLCLPSILGQHILCPCLPNPGWA